ncbi:MAG: DUF4124 domain-containing protein [Pseudomonadota bacterium]
MRNVFVIVLAAVVASNADAQQIYRWVDADGVVHYSDQPEPDSNSSDVETVDIDVPPGISDPTRQLRAQPAPLAGSQAQPAGSLLEQQQGIATDAPPAYRGAVVQSPEEQQVLWNLATRLPVSVQVTPALTGTDRIQFLLDDQTIGEPINGTSTVLSPVYRGRHTIVATIIDTNGQTIFRGEPITFYVQQAGRAN